MPKDAKEPKEPHRIAWFASRRAKCSCGDSFEIAYEDRIMLTSEQAADLLLDAYSEHREKNK